jgi:predicted GNAT family N-acyltransferase
LSKLRVEISKTEDLPQDLKSEIRRWLVETFLDEHDDTAWANVDWHILGWVGEELVSHVEIIERVVLVGNEMLAVGGIGGVVTKPHWRHRGYASSIMKIAQKHLCESLRLKFGLLMCDESVIPFYEQLGWKVISGPLVCEQPSGKIAFDDIVMVYSGRNEDFPEGLIDAQGPPW